MYCKHADQNLYMTHILQYAINPSLHKWFVFPLQVPNLMTIFTHKANHKRQTIMTKMSIMCP